MGNLLDRGARWLKGQREKHATTAADYRRGGSLVPVTATIGRKVFRLTDSYGAPLRIETRDYLIGAEQLTDEPQVGDVIEEGGQAYEVTSPGGEPCWEWSDSFRRTYRVHTTHIGAVDG
jgi:hypothetical protein